ncbi:hypothetical protein ATSB10_37760 [Dyella thiooxydans]|uniref:Uncharacterized protein n=1 Tax=Dyella thiooxydans TaxID=445710 RepID=A0A160N5E4_9GAMM|nr:hypothetical protein ATSB10_37760 [Dyella thiooxydans]
MRHGVAAGSERGAATGGEGGEQERAEEAHGACPVASEPRTLGSP